MKQPETVTTDSFKQVVLRAEQPVLVDFWADWCGPCRKMAPVIDEIAAEASAVKVCKVNVDDNPQLAGLYHISSVPTLMLFRGGKPAAMTTGMHSKESVMQLIGMQRDKEEMKNGSTH